MGTYSAWESTATLRLLGGARGSGAPTGGGEGRGHIVSPRAQLVINNFRQGGYVYNGVCLSVNRKAVDRFLISDWEK